MTAMHVSANQQAIARLPVWCMALVLMSPLAALAQKPAPVAAASEEKVLNFSNWPDYMPGDLLKEFEQKTGIRVQYRLYESNEELQKKVELGTDADDLVVPGIGYAKGQLIKGLYRPLDKSLLPNLRNVDSSLSKAMDVADPGNRHFVPWAWGYNTLFVNRTQVMKALIGQKDHQGVTQKTLPYPANEWELVFNPTYTRRFRDCGIGMLESPSEVMPLALMYMGKSPYSQLESDYKEAARMLKRIRPDVRTFSNTMIKVINSGKVCVALAWSGDIRTAIETLKEQGNTDALDGLQPSRGSTRFIDVLAIPKNARHPKNAHTFINYYLDAMQGARMPNEIGYPNGNLAALPHVDESVRQSPLVFPGADFSLKLVAPDGHTMGARWAMMHAFMSFAFNLEVD